MHRCSLNMGLYSYSYYFYQSLSYKLLALVSLDINATRGFSKTNMHAQNSGKLQTGYFLVLGCRYPPPLYGFLTQDPFNTWPEMIIIDRKSIRVSSPWGMRDVGELYPTTLIVNMVEVRASGLQN